MEYKKEIEENVRSGMLDLMILKLLTEQDMYGYQIDKEITRRTSGAYHIKRGSLYTPIYRMSEKGLIFSYSMQVSDKRTRVYYSIGAEGRRYLEYGLEQIRQVFAGLELLFFGEDNSK